MKVMKINTVLGSRFLKIFKLTLLDNINSIKSLGQYDELFENYSQKDIEEEIEKIYLLGGYICIPTDSLFLRLIQYGGYKIKAPGLLSRTCRELGGEML